MPLSVRFPALAVLILATATLCTAQAAANWNYFGKTGPLGWGRLDPAYQACSKGHEQSPIDIRGVHLNKALQPIEFHYMSGAVAVENTGHTIAVRVNPGSYIVADGVRYDLIEYDFHHPGEEAVKGKLTDMSVHLL
ncbi:MAG: carbonic anhydrase family protein, partial [Formivibrio sp.]|nr:carbonic anhydrase family protein [Formivibrio sp.]